jgi:hypothetical protein
MLVDDEGMAVAQPLMPMWMRMRLWPLPALVIMLMMLVTDMHVFVTPSLVNMLDLIRIT